MTPPPRPTPREAHEGRDAALAVLYLVEVGRVTPGQALETYFAEHRPDAPEAVRAFADWLVGGVAHEAADLDRQIARHATNWRLERLAIVDRQILRLAWFELRTRTDQAPAIVINEALELARRYSGEASVGFVNGVLDALRQALAAGDATAAGETTTDVE